MQQQWKGKLKNTVVPGEQKINEIGMKTWNNSMRKLTKIKFL